MAAKVDYVPVYSINESRREKAKSSIPRTEAEAYVADGVAKWNNPKQTVLIMQRLDFQIPGVAPSLKPNIRIMDAYVEGKPHAVAIINSYRYKFAA